MVAVYKLWEIRELKTASNVPWAVFAAFNLFKQLP